MDRLAASMGRAMRGLRYSQVVVTSRARAAFMERARLALGWDPDRMQAVQGDREALGRLFGDELADFLYLRTGDLEERFPSAFQTPGRGAFVKEFGEILAKMGSRASSLARGPSSSAYSGRSSGTGTC
jgi:hypothetical protein